MRGNVLDKIRADFNTDKRDRRVLTKGVDESMAEYYDFCWQMRTACLAYG